MGDLSVRREPVTGAAEPQSHTNNDHNVLIVIGMAALLVIFAFGLVIYGAGLLHFPERAAGTARDLNLEILDYRERRATLVLLLRTFTVIFGFLVGLILCTYGGLFILRRLEGRTDIALNGSGGESGPVIGGLRLPRFSVSAYSPGIIFLLGGVGIMVSTQLLSLPVNIAELVPAGTRPVCETHESGRTVWRSCDQASPKPTALPEDEAQQRADAEDIGMITAVGSAAPGQEGDEPEPVAGAEPAFPAGVTSGIGSTD